MFENITRGEFVLNKHAKSNVETSAGRSIASCAGYSTNTDNGEHITENYANAEFIAYCFNLQQKYDISKLEELIQSAEVLLGRIKENDMDNWFSYKAVKQLLTKIIK